MTEAGMSLPLLTFLFLQDTMVLALRVAAPSLNLKLCYAISYNFLYRFGFNADSSGGLDADASCYHLSHCDCCVRWSHYAGRVGQFGRSGVVKGRRPASRVGSDRISAFPSTASAHDVRPITKRTQNRSVCLCLPASSSSQQPESYLQF